MTALPETTSRPVREAPTITDAIGATPLVGLRSIRPKNGAEVLVKVEMLNPACSVKDRIGSAMIEQGERDGHIEASTHIVEPTSGNTGIALAFVCAAKGYRLTLCMPESMSLERRAVLRQLGAELVLTPKEKGIPGAVARATELAQELRDRGEDIFTPQQFENPANPAIHEATTGPEIWEATGGRIDAIVAGVGTGGTVTGVTRFMRTKNPDFKTFAVEPEASPVLSGGEPGPHMIQGIGAGFVPGVLDVDLLTGVERVSNEEAFAWAKRLAREEGLLGGISTGANVCAAVRVAERDEFAGKRIVTIACSTAERYLSTALFEEARAAD